MTGPWREFRRRTFTGRHVTQDELVEILSSFDDSLDIRYGSFAGGGGHVEVVDDKGHVVASFIETGDRV